MSCNIVRLCGITSRFQLLSPSTRQVTHALLTRPPLSHKELQTEVIRSKCFVRLACVKHAASVHPEPGSNSLNKCLLQVKINSWLIYPFYCFLRIFRSFVFMILKRTFEECVSLFSYQRSVLHCRLSQTALLLYHVVSCLSRTFSFLFDSFVISVRSLRRNSDRIPPYT